MSTAAEEVTNKAGAAEELTNAPLLPPELLTSVVEFSTFAEVHAAPRCVSREWRAAVRRATTHGRWKPVKFVADQGEALCRAGAVPARTRIWRFLLEGSRSPQSRLDLPFALL